MSRSPRARQVDVAERIRLFAEHHIVAVRTQRRTGEIVAVKHMAWGWISPQAYYVMQEAHKILPLVEKVIEGGYRFKQAVIGLSADILGVSIPLGAGFLAYEIAHLSAATAGFDLRTFKLWDQKEVLFWLASLLAPFGEILGMVRLLQELGVAAHVEMATPEERGGAVEETVKTPAEQIDAQLDEKLREANLGLKAGF